MVTSSKKLLSLLFFAFLTQSYSLQGGWGDYFSSLSFDKQNLKNWTIPALSVGAATLVLGYIGYRYLSKKAPHQKIERFFADIEIPTIKTIETDDVIKANGLLIPVFKGDNIVLSKQQEISINGKIPIIIKRSYQLRSIPFQTTNHITQAEFPSYIEVEQHNLNNTTLPKIVGDSNFIDDIELYVENNTLKIRFTKDKDIRKAYQTDNQPLCKIFFEKLNSKKPICINTHQLEVLNQSDPSSCGFHSLKNAATLLECFAEDKKSITYRFKFENLNNEIYFLNTILPRFKPIAVNIRKKMALQEYIQKEILTPCLQKKEAAYTNALTNCAVGIAEHAMKHLEDHEEFCIPHTHVITLLHESLPGEKKQFYPIELFQQAFKIEKDIIITHDMVKQAFYKKYLTPILRKQKIILSENELTQLIATLEQTTYDDFVRTMNTLKDSDPSLTTQLKDVHEKMQHSENIDLLLQEEATIKRTWLEEKLHQHNLIFPKNEVLFDVFIANPYLFADLQGFWLEGDEVRELIKSCDDSIKRSITIIDSIEELQSDDLVHENTHLAGIKNSWNNFDQYNHAFIINTASQFKPEERGHWFVIVIHKKEKNKEFIVLNSQRTNRKGIVIGAQGIMHSQEICDYVEHVKILEKFLEA